MLLGLGLDHEEGEEEQVYKWWLEEEKEGGVKWERLEHQGPLFPPSYEPHGIKMKYDGIFLFFFSNISQGRDVDLTPPSEEVGSFFAALLETDYAKNATFCKNFFSDFLDVLKKEKKVRERVCVEEVFVLCFFGDLFHD